MLRLGVTAAMVFVTGIAFSRPASGDEAPVFNRHGNSLQAQLSTGTTHLDAHDVTFSDLAKDEAPPLQRSSFVSVCVELPTRTICGNAVLSADQFQVSGNLKTAFLRADVPAQDCSRIAPYACSDSTLHVNLTWRGTEPLSFGRFHNKLFGGACHINEVGRSAGRQAEVLGSITDGTTVFVTGVAENFAGISRSTWQGTGRGIEDCL